MAKCAIFLYDLDNKSSWEVEKVGEQKQLFGVTGIPGQNLCP